CAQAQNISKFVISDEAAKKTLVKNEISADTAAKITQACVDWATKNNQAVSVFVLSPTGQIVHAHRMDGQVPINTETALLKAQSVLYTRDSTHAGRTRSPTMCLFSCAGTSYRYFRFQADCRLSW